MAAVVITLIGDDRAGLVNAVSAVVVQHGANWERSHLTELAGKFAGIVLVEVGDDVVEALLGDLQKLEAAGLLAITAERAHADAAPPEGLSHVSLELMGQDHVGIVHEISQLLTDQGVSIDELETTIAPAPQGGNLFIANAVLELPTGVTIDTVRAALEALANDLMVDLDVVGDDRHA